MAKRKIKQAADAITIGGLKRFLNELPDDADVYVSNFGLVVVRKGVAGVDVIALRKDVSEAA